MKCLICSGILDSFFVKDFNQEYNLSKVHYDKCINCGVVIARELIDIPIYKWEKLNNDFHSLFLYKSEFDLDPNWNNRIDNQVNDIKDLHCSNIINASMCLDYACGDGRLLDGLANNNIAGIGYDKYTDFISGAAFLKYKYDLVINTSFFEHIRERKDIEIVNNLVSDYGCLALHTLVCENIPRDPDWFYLVPVHSVLYTNKSMKILFSEWKYKYSLYNPVSRMWFWLKKNIDTTNLPDRFLIKDGFVDYWE